MTDIDFAAVLCSRLCHDLVSPVGAMSNGLEILNEETDASMQEQVMDLLQKSTRQTTNKLQFFRLAFGAGGGFSSQLDMREAEKALFAYFEGSRVNLIWNVPLPHVSKQMVKFLLNTAMVSGESMIRGGDLNVNMSEKDNKIHLFITAQTPRFLMADTIRDALMGDMEESLLDPRTAPAYLAGQVARELNGTISVLKVTEEETHIQAILDKE